MKFHKRIWAGALAAVLASQVFIGVPAARAQSVNLQSTEILTSGAVVKSYIWKSTRKGVKVSTNAKVVEVDLTNPNVKIDTITGTNEQYTKNQTVLNMAKETGAVAAVNGDFFIMMAEGVPLGAQIMNGKLMSSTSDNMKGMYSFGLTKDNQPVIDLFGFKGSITAANGTSYPLEGYNKTYYWYDDGSTQSTDNGLLMYTDTWPLAERSNNGTSIPTEVKVQNGIITDIAINTTIKEVPPADGYILRAAGKSADYVKENLKVGDQLVAEYGLISQDSSKTYDLANFKTLIGGHTILVDGGQPAKFSRSVSELNGNRSRTGVGYSKDMKKVYIITIDEAFGSDGMTLEEMQSFMVSIGVWKGMNMDGGGSTQMAVRPLGEFTPVQTNVNESNNSYTRPVVNGLGVFSLAPKGTTVKGLTLGGHDEVFLGEKINFTIKGYDEYYNPVKIDETMNPEWSSSTDVGKFDGKSFVPIKIGMTKITSKIGSGTATKDIHVLGSDDISALKVTASSQVLKEGETIKLKASITDRNSKSRSIAPDVLKWEVDGLDAKVVGDELKIGSLKDVSLARVIAKYDGFSTMLSLPIGQEKMWYDLDHDAVMTNSDVFPADVEGTVQIVQEETGNKALELAYDFKGGTGNKALYATFNGKDGANIDGKPQYMKMNVFGDNSNNWVRAEIIDGDGDLNLITFTENMNWDGWKELTVNLADYRLTYPIKVMNVYVTNPAEQQDERALEGKIMIDNISFIYPTSTQPKTNAKLVTMTLNNKTVQMDDKKIKLEQAPVEIDSRTMVPIRFIAEAFGGEVKWDPKAKKTTIFLGNKMIELWNGKDEMVFTGKRVKTDVGPRIMNGLTLVPLRVIAEELNWTVGWDAKTKTITLK
ncbi:copper amine oxidase [Paenibacillus albiflavus]|uniref:Copper amine oxidase n=1 Tax=Paenibacillus albiflavus TaxID=2545760 RepID=A0A4R4DZM9_9BACL|nr:stalk domain-containing protein [Paenibacillus albiflavus]TCZ71851.1 copper amine oxidase [Paenibacillus albiflavus]